METPTASKIVEIELLKLKNENQFRFDDNLTPFSLKVRNQVNRDNGVMESPIPSSIKKSNTLDALNLELIEFPRFEDFESIAQKIEKEDELDSEEDDAEDEQEEDLPNISNDSSDMKLDALGIQDSPLMRFPVFQDAEFLKIPDITGIEGDKNADTSLEEFPLVDFSHQSNVIIDHEEVLKTPEIIRTSATSSTEDESIAERTRHKGENSSSPTKKPSTQIKKSKSKIPLPTSSLNQEVRRSRRLEDQVPVYSSDKNVCSPRKPKSNPIPILRIKSENALNLIVDSSTGKLHDATQYATEINSKNGEGVPIPQTTNEQVTVPVNGPRRTKITKSAIVRGYMLKLASANGIEKPMSNGSSSKLGFYTEADYKKYFNPKHSPVKVMKPKPNGSPIKKSKGKELKKRSVRWAEQLEW